MLLVKFFSVIPAFYQMSFPRRRESRKIVRLDSRLRGNDKEECGNDAGSRGNDVGGWKCYFLVRSMMLFLATLLFITIGLARPARAADQVLDTILNTLENLTCETQGVGNLLRSEFSHTCIPAPFFTFLVANIVSPGLYANTLLRLTINDKELFPDSCARGNRIEFNDQKLSFAMCNNIKLAGAIAPAVANTAVAITRSLFTGTDPWDDIVNTWNLSKASYHNIYIDKREGDEGIMFDIGAIPVFPWRVIRENDKMCVATQSFGGWIPIGCKYIKEPFPISIYADFLDLSPEGVGELAKLTSLTTCGNMGSCYKRAYTNSRTAIVMSGPLIECVKEMVAKLLVSNAVCSFDDVKLVLNSNLRTTSALFQFQKKMHLAVSALLTIYVIFFGFKIVLSGDVPPKSEFVNFAVKFLFVVYFSVGININGGGGSDLDRMDGMIQWAFPFMLDGMNQLASWIINASPSELCKFTDVEYPSNLRHLQLWDSLDCKISHYLGLDAIQTMVADAASRYHDFAKLDILSFPIPPYIYLLVPAIYSGNIQLFSLALMYPLLVISVGAFVVNATVVCMISIVVLGVLAPVFVPMYLFNYTKGYFDAWVRLLISFMLQPMVAVVFMTAMLSVYDFGFYGTCKYAHKDFTYSGPNVDIQLGGLTPSNVSVLDARSVRYFYVDQDWTRSYNNQEEVDGCRNSLGFILSNPFQFLFDTGKSLGKDAVMPWINDASGEEDKKRFDFLSAISSSPGMFFNTVEVLFEKIKALVIALLTACFTLYLMYHFSASLAEFAADMTEGVSIGNLAIRPQALYKAGMTAIALQQSSEAKDQSATGEGGASDKLSTSGERAADDKVSTGGGAGGKVSTDKGLGGGAGDKVSTSSNQGLTDGAGEKFKAIGGTAAASNLKSALTAGFDASKAVSTSVQGKEVEKNEDESKLKPPTLAIKPSGEDEGGEK